MAKHWVRGLLRGGALGWWCAAMAIVPFSLRAAEPAAGSGSSGALDQWRAIKKMAGEIVAMPAGQERLDRCQAFLKEHPDFPDSYNLLETLVIDWLTLPGNDPAQAVQLLERRAASGDGQYGRTNLRLVEQYYLPHHLSTASALRLLATSRKQLEETRRLAAREPDAAMRYQMGPDWTEFRLLIDEGRVMLQSGDASGGLAKLREAEARRDQLGAAVQLRDLQGNLLETLPSYEPLWNGMNLAMAQAYAALGKRGAAKERLAWVRGAGEGFGEIEEPAEKLSEQLGVAPEGVAEMRAEAMAAPDFDLEDLEGKRTRLSDYKDKIVLVMLWATW